MTSSRRIYPTLAAYLDAHPRGEANRLAAHVGVSRSLISHLRHGRCSASLRLADLISRAARVPLESFLRGSK